MNLVYAVLCGAFLSFGCRAAGVDAVGCVWFGLAATAGLISLWLTSQEIGR